MILTSHKHTILEWIKLCQHSAYTFNLLINNSQIITKFISYSSLRLLTIFMKKNIQITHITWI